jgi:hypothetical protein
MMTATIGWGKSQNRIHKIDIYARAPGILDRCLG